MTSTTTVDTCNQGSNLRPIQGFFSIGVQGTSIVIGGVCCAVGLFGELSGTGSMDGTQVMIQSNRMIFSSSTCSWQIDEVDAGTLDAVGFSGAASLTVSAVGDCGPGFPCKVRGIFTAERCPYAKCGVMCSGFCT